MSDVKPQPLLIKRKVVRDDGALNVEIECGHPVLKLGTLFARTFLALSGRDPKTSAVGQEMTCLDCTHKPDERAAADARIAAAKKASDAS